MMDYSTPVFFKMAGELDEHIILLLPDIAASKLSQKRPCFLQAIFPSLYKPRQARHDGGHEAGRIIRFG